MSIMKAEVTAEKRPDFLTPQSCLLCERGETHKNKSSVQIFIVLLLKVVVMFGDFLLELVVETGSRIRAAIFLQYRFQSIA